MMEDLQMSNSTFNNLSLPHDAEITSHLPESFQLMIRIQQDAEREFDAIVADIKAGKTTLEAVKRQRGLS